MNNAVIVGAIALIASLPVRPSPDTPDQYRVLQTIETPQGSRNMGLDPTNHRVFVVSAKFGEAPAGGRARGPVLPGSFTLMVIERDPAAR